MNLKSIILGFLLLWVLSFVLITSNVRANFNNIENTTNFAMSDLFSSIEPVVKILNNYEYSSLFSGNFEQIIWTRFEFEDFSASYGDYFLVDVENAIGYLINETSRYYTVFPIMTGAKRTPTPFKDWVVLEKSVKNDRITFGQTGEFFRMYLNEGKTRTAYGIHGYGYFEYEIENARKFLSLGCVLVSDPVLDLIEESYNANEKSLRVITRESVDLINYFESIAG